MCKETFKDHHKTPMTWLMKFKASVVDKNNSSLEMTKMCNPINKKRLTWTSGWHRLEDTSPQHTTNLNGGGGGIITTIIIMLCGCFSGIKSQKLVGEKIVFLHDLFSWGDPMHPEKSTPELFKFWDGNSPDGLNWSQCGRHFWVLLILQQSDRTWAFLQRGNGKDYICAYLTVIDTQICINTSTTTVSYRNKQ